ncbi:hypothetical protein OS189_11470 [Sulfitobacter sp. F26169L]|uniref:hypothetical protein n=1 Tax=Sulfitobacter sp. F26169L TaxID=2996015 RepID=UPI0022609069|nr:hypothetical protein [Sulfitobacter sp. F26169L]MCX7566960.1 hypothetical protein [Sulfitobacter sp. F26169L]
MKARACSFSKGVGAAPDITAPAVQPWPDCIRVWLIDAQLQVFFEIKLSQLFLQVVVVAVQNLIWVNGATLVGEGFFALGS